MSSNLGGRKGENVTRPSHKAPEAFFYCMVIGLSSCSFVLSLCVDSTNVNKNIMWKLETTNINEKKRFITQPHRNNSTSLSETPEIRVRNVY